MDYTKSVFLDLLANCICEDKRINRIDFQKLDSDNLIYMSRVNTVSAIVYSAIKDIENVPQDLLDIFKSEFEKEVLRSSKYRTVLEMVAEKLNASKIPYIIVKGKTIAKYYPSEELRHMSDLDVVVSPKDFGEAKKLFETFCLKKPGQIDDKYEISYVLNGVNIELQNNLAYGNELSGKYDYESYFNDLINHRIADGKIIEVEPSHGFIFNIYHMAEHFYYGGCGVRMILDIAVLIKQFKDVFDWNQILESLKELELFDFATNVFSIIDEWLNIRIPSEKYEKRKVPDESIEYFINAGIFGRAKINSDVANVRKSNSFFKWAFPSYKYMRESNEWFRNKPTILLPVAYVERMIRGLRHRGGVVKGISVMGQTKKDLDKHKEMVKIMGLE